MAWQRALPVSALEESQPAHVLLGERMVMLVLQRGEVHATDAICPHKFTLLTSGEVHDGAITCPQHEATFDLTTGAPQEGCDWAGVLPIHASRVVDGHVEVDLD